jgi:hypothetical protein
MAPKPLAIRPTAERTFRSADKSRSYTNAWIAFGKLIVLDKQPARASRVGGRGNEVSMKALLSTTLVLSAVTLAAVGLAAATLVATLLAASTGFAADAAIPREFAPVDFQGSFAPNRLDVYDLRRELAREAEHDRIRTRLGDPFRWCGPAGVPGRPGLLIVCR